MRIAIVAASIALFFAVFNLNMAGQRESSSTGLLRNGPPIPEKSGVLRKALLLLRQGKTLAAREELSKLLKSRPDDAEIHHQIARSHLMDFHANPDPAQRRI